MFDRISFGTGQANSYVTGKVDIVEKRAATDESIKLLMEMEEKAKNNLIDRFEMKDNSFEGHALVFNDVFTREKEVCVDFRLNGKTYRASTKFDPNAVISAEDVNKLFVESIRDAILKSLLEHIKPLRKVGNYFSQY